MHPRWKRHDLRSHLEKKIPIPMAATAMFDRATLRNGQSIIVHFFRALRPALSRETVLFTPDERDRWWCLIVRVQVDSLVRV